MDRVYVERPRWFAAVPLDDGADEQWRLIGIERKLSSARSKAGDGRLQSIWWVQTGKL